jgi:phosphoglycerate dehydrogenase-like enzyme
MSVWQLLVIRAPEDGPDLRIDQAQLDAAQARAGHKVTIVPRFLDIDGADVPDAISSADALVGWRLPTQSIRAHAAGLRLIQLTNAGIDNLIPLDWLPASTALCNASGIHAARLQEWAAMVLLMLHAQMPHFATAQRDHAWSRRSSSRIAGTTALIYGTGALGGAVARAARGLGLSTLGISRTGSPSADFDRVLGLDAQAQFLPAADFVILTLPLTSATRGLANAGFFARMRAGAGFANFGRGALVDQPALCAALDRGTPGGAIIDVATPEPLPADSPLWSAKNLIITPHVSCDDPATYVPDALDLLIDNLARLERGAPLRNWIDPGRGY